MTSMPEPKPAKTVVVDEGVSGDNVLRFSNFAAGRGLMFGSFAQLEFVPVSKGRHVEMLRNKLTQLLACRDTNEIQQENFREIMCRFTEQGKMLTQPDMFGAEELAT